MKMKKIIDYDVIITKNDKINEHYYLLSISKPSDFDVLPGQFVNIKIEPDSIEPFLRRPFSVFYINEYEIGILYQVKGQGTKLLSTKKIGSKLKMLGPLGNSFPLEKKVINEFDSLFLVAGGIGIAPLYFYASRIKENYEYIDIHLIYGIKDETYLLPDDFVKYYFSSIYFGLEKAISYNSNFYSGCHCKFFNSTAIMILENDDFNTLIKRYKNPLFAVCGPDGMLKAFVDWNSKERFCKAYLSLESFMGCGFHACLGCAIEKSKGGYIYLCDEGPVVFYSDIKL